VELELPAPSRFDQVRVREATALGQRVEGWALDAVVGGAWNTIAVGTTVGVRRILRFEPVTASRVRLRVTKARGCPAVAEVALFLSAPVP
jgi:alpha-L-fucosidase